MAIENENEQKKSTAYRGGFCNEENKELQEELKAVTPAGKSCYLKPESQLIRP